MASSLAKDESVQRTCGWQRKVAEDILEFLELALEEGSMSLTESRCKHILKPLEAIDGERDGKDRGPFRLLKAVSTLLRLRGYKRGEPPFREIIIYGQPLLGSSQSVRALEQAVHLCRSCAKLKCVQLINCQLDASEACVVEVIRLVKLLGQGESGHFLQELNLSENSFDDPAAQRIIEAALRDRCRNPPGNGRPSSASTAPLWLDLSANCIKRPQNVFQKMEAWSAWAYREKSICLAKSSSCSKQECKHSSMLHLPAFMEQEQKASPLVLVENARNGSAEGKAAVRPSISLRPGPGARISRSRSPRSKSSGLSADEQESSEDEAVEEEEEEEEEIEDDEVEGDVDVDDHPRKRRRTCSDSSAASGSEELLSQAQVEERLDRLLNQLRSLHQEAAQPSQAAGPASEAAEGPAPSLVEPGMQDLSEKPAEHEMPLEIPAEQEMEEIPSQHEISADEMKAEEEKLVDREEIRAEGSEMPAEQEETKANKHEMHADELNTLQQEISADQEEIMAEQKKLQADQQKTPEGLEMPAEQEEIHENHNELPLEEKEMPPKDENSAGKQEMVAEHETLPADQQEVLESMTGEIEIDPSLAKLGEIAIRGKAPYEDLEMMEMDSGSQIAT